MKKILLYTDTNIAGGAELQMFLLAKFLDKNQFTPILACSKHPALDRWCENFQKEGIKVIRLNANWKHNPKHFFALKRIIKNEKVDLLHVHIWNPASCRYAFLAAGNTAMISTEHDPFKLNGFKNVFKKWTLKKLQKIITVSNQNAKVFKELFPDHAKKIEVIHNGIDTTWWQSQILRFSEKDREKIREQIFKVQETENSKTQVIVSIAELNPRKGLDILIKAYAKISSKYPNTKLIIIGEGAQRGELEDLIQHLKLEESCLLIGRQKNIPQLLKSADIFVLPSRREAFGLANLEAMISELPVISTTAGGIPEVIENGKTGILVEPENIDDLAEAISTLLTNTGKSEKIAQNGHDSVIKNFNAKKMAEEYEVMYNSIINK